VFVLGSSKSYKLEEANGSKLVGAHTSNCCLCVQRSCFTSPQISMFSAGIFLILWQDPETPAAACIQVACASLPAFTHSLSDLMVLSN
jgi:hypothetical protein